MSSFFPGFSSLRGTQDVQPVGEPEFHGVRFDRVDYTAPTDATQTAAVTESPEVALRRQIDANDQAIRLTLARITEKMRELDPSQQQLVLAGFANHWTGQDYQVYDHIRNAVTA